MTEPTVSMMSELYKLLQSFNHLSVERDEREHERNTNDDGIPRSMFLEIDPWDPDDSGALSVTAFFSIFEDVAAALPQPKRVRLLRARLRGTAKQFLIDHNDLLQEEHPYDAVKNAMFQWYEQGNPAKSTALLCTVKRQPTETLRQFAERVHHIARSAVLDKRPELTAAQKSAWVKKRVIRAFIKGLGRDLSSHLLNADPGTIEDALKRAEVLEETLELTKDDDDKWDLAAVQPSETSRCYSCGELGHFAAQCTNKREPRGKPHHPPKNYGNPQQKRPYPRYPCLFCGDSFHFPVNCQHNPQKAIFCDYCGAREHLEENCLKKKQLLPVSNPPGARNDTPANSPKAIMAPEPVPIPIVARHLNRALKVATTLSNIGTRHPCSWNTHQTNQHHCMGSRWVPP